MHVGRKVSPMSSTADARPGAEAVERAARQLLDAGLREGDFAFTPARAIWTAEVADALDRAYVQRLDFGAGDRPVLPDEVGRRASADLRRALLRGRHLGARAGPVRHARGGSGRSRSSSSISAGVRLLSHAFSSSTCLPPLRTTWLQDAWRSSGETSGDEVPGGRQAQSAQDAWLAGRTSRSNDSCRS